MEGQGQAQQEPNEPQPEQFCQLERQYKWAILISCLILIDLSIDAAHFDFSKKSTPVSNAPCSSRERLLPDWVWYYNIGYYYSEQRKNWTDSKKFCEVQGAQLAVLQDDFIKAFINQIKIQFFSRKDKKRRGGKKFYKHPKMSFVSRKMVTIIGAEATSGKMS
ncbi:uncharacterized protein [Pyxicephalus adspersus]|uniref:uncharacterized protein isoform X2 n=1 Tax=Pyxicephalus adspersus TaxID=30357 RepID=UPI003B5BA1D7